MLSELRAEEEEETYDAQALDIRETPTPCGDGSNLVFGQIQL